LLKLAFPHTEQELKEAKTQLKKVIDQIKSTANQLSKTNLKEEGAKLQKSADDIEKIGGVEPEVTVQTDNWVGTDETIVSEVYDPQGNTVPLDVLYEKLRDGKFNIKVAFDQNSKPGLYKLKTTLTVDGKTYVSEEEFAWGLVSLNTKKSIYKPGETAEFVIVVLDSAGHPVCDANLSMNIIQPNSQITNLTSGNGITQNEECGLYDAEYLTSMEGTHSVDIKAITEGINTDFSTTFDVAEFYEFDIIRTAQSKIDPKNNPNSFDVRIDIESFVGSQSIQIQEFVPSVFNVVTDANVQTVDGKNILTWNNDLVENKTFVEYTYSVPLEWPKLYALGPAEINYGQSQTFTEARPWFVAVDPDSAFKDGVSAGIGITVASIDSVVTTFAASTENIVIACVQLENTAAAVGTIAAGDLELRRGTGVADPLVAETQYQISLSAAAGTMPDRFMCLQGLDTPTAANPTYAVLAGAGATGINAEVKFVVINQAPNTAFVDGANFALTGGADTIATLTTTLPSPATDPAVIIALIHEDCSTPGSRCEFAIGDIDIRRGVTELATNQFAINLRASTANGDGFFAMLIARDTAAGANPTYTVVATDGRAQGTTQMEAKILAFSGLSSSFTDTTNVPIGIARTVIGNTVTTFPVGTDVSIAAFQHEGGVAKDFAVDSMELQEASETPDSSNELIYHKAATGARGEQRWQAFLHQTTTTAANPTYEGARTAPSVGTNAELKIIAIHIKNAPFVRTLSDTLNTSDGVPNTTLVFTRTLSDVLNTADGVPTTTVVFTRTLSDVLNTADGVPTTTLVFTRTLSDVLNTADGVQITI